MKSLARLAALFALSAASGKAEAGTLGSVPGPNFLYVRNAAGLAQAACTPPDAAKLVLLDAVESIHESSGLDPQISVILSSASLGCGDLFYVPVANDTRGLGYEHQDARGVFDDSPDSRLEGIAFLNDFPYWQSHPAEFANDFNHEIAHRFGARVHVTMPGIPEDAILGRQLQHWSYFLDSQGSPLEGNRWTDLGSQRFRADTPAGPGAFSDLDLYLMGVLPPASVAPAILLRADPLHATDCFGGEVAADSPPQSCKPLELTATAVLVPIDAVIRAEGPRDPPALVQHRTLDVAIILLQSSEAPFERASCRALASAIEQHIADFEHSSRGLVSLRNLTASNASCDDWPTPHPSRPESDSGCGLARRGGPHGVALSWAVVLYVALLSTRRRTMVP